MKYSIKIFIVTLLCVLILPSLEAEIELTKSKNEIFIMKKDKNNWERLETGDEIDEGSQIKTGKGNGIITIDDKTFLYLRQNTVLKIEKKDKIMVELREGAVHLTSKGVPNNIVFSSLLGELTIKSKNTLIKYINNNLLVSVFDNVVIAKIKKREIAINQGYGLEITPKLDSFDVFPLPSAPVPEFPEDKSIISSGVNLIWTKIDEAILYRLEIALDKNFIEIVKEEDLSTATFSTKDLSESQYFWRVSTINRKNLEGVFFDVNSFFVQKTSSGLTITEKSEKKKDVKVTKIPVEDEDDLEENIDDYKLEEDSAGSAIMGGAVLLSLVILLIL